MCSFSRSHDGVSCGKTPLRHLFQSFSNINTLVSESPPHTHAHTHVRALLNLRQRLTYFTLPAWNDVTTEWTCECFLNVGPSCRVCLHSLVVGGANSDVIKEDKEDNKNITRTCLRFSVLVM